MIRINFKNNIAILFTNILCLTNVYLLLVITFCIKHNFKINDILSMACAQYSLFEDKLYCKCNKGGIIFEL